MKNESIIVLIVLSVALISSIKIEVKAEAETIVVPDDYLSVFDAMEAAHDGDTIYVKAGTYNGPINQTLVIDKSVSLIGEDKENTTLIFFPPLVETTIFTQTFWVRNSPILVFTNNFTLSDFTIDTIGGPHPTSVKQKMEVYGNNTKIKNNNMLMGIHISGSYSLITENNITGDLNTNGSHQTITQNTISVIDFGVECSGSFNNISTNIIYGSGGGIHSSGSYNTIYGNNLTTISGIHVGLDMSGNGNLVAYNNVTDGIGVGGSDHIIYGNRVPLGFALVGFNNTFYSNDAYGVAIGNRIKDSANNIFYHNNFVGENPFDIGEGVHGPNFWDNGKEGNYWTGYKGTDSNGDGIGDTPYVIDENKQDNYPLMEPVEIETIPEFSSWTILSLFLTVTIVVLIFRKKTRSNDLLV